MDHTYFLLKDMIKSSDYMQSIRLQKVLALMPMNRTSKTLYHQVNFLNKTIVGYTVTATIVPLDKTGAI